MKTGLLKEVFLMAMDSIRLNKLRSFLTILGIVIGILTIVSMVAVIEGINTSFTKELESMGSNMLFISKYEPGAHNRRQFEEMEKRKNLTIADTIAIKEKCPSVISTTPIFSFFRFMPPVKVKYRENSLENPQIWGVSHDFLLIYEYYSVQAGRFFTLGENLNSSMVCVLGTEITDALFPHVDPIDKTILIDNARFRVIGQLTKQGKFLMQNRDNIVIVPYQTFQKSFHRPRDRGVDQIIVKVRSTADLEASKNDIINLMRIRRKVKANQENDFAIFSQETFSTMFNQMTGAAFAVMIIISSIALLVGGIGVMNIMLVSVKERTREIGLRKALGARKGEIHRQFLYEAIILTQTGGFIGMILGISISFIIKSVTKLPVSVNIVSLLLGIFTATGVGLFFGIYPASQAAKLNAVDALRYE